MTITPSFQLSQTTTHILLTIHIPYTRITEMQVDIDHNEIHFYCKPYLLHLTLSHNVLDTDAFPAKAKYDAETMDVAIDIPKEEEGLQFADLDLISKFLQPKKMKDDPVFRGQEKKLIEVLGDKDPNEGESDKNQGSVENKESLLNIFCPKYGFANGCSNVFHKNRECLHFEMLLSRNVTPEDVPDAEERRGMRKEVEEERFDLDRFILDNEELEGDAIYELAMNQVPHWEQESDNDSIDQITQQLQQSLSIHDKIIFTRDERDAMARIRARTPPTSPRDYPIQPLLMGLFDILTAYAYDHRITDGEPTCESAWNVGILSPTLSWFEDYSSMEVEEMMTQSMRRLVIYPYLRNFDLGTRCLRDALCIMTCGKRNVLKCLLAVQSIFEHSENYYVWNTLYVNNYCIWVQFIEDVLFKDFTTKVASVLDQWVHHPDFVKRSLGLGLEVLLDDDDSSSEYSESDDEETELSYESASESHNSNDSSREEQPLNDLTTGNDDHVHNIINHSKQECNKLLIEEKINRSNVEYNDKKEHGLKSFVMKNDDNMHDTSDHSKQHNKKVLIEEMN